MNMWMTTCLHGVDLRFTPRCYLCKPWPDDSPVWKVTSPGHVHEGEWCAMCVEHGAYEARAPLDVEAQLDGVKALFRELISTDSGGYLPASAGVKDKNGMFEDWIAVGFVFECYERLRAALEEPTP